MAKGSEPGVATVEWTGAEGYERFRQRYGFAVPDPRAYRASLRTAAVDGIRVGEWTTSPVAGVRRRVEGGGAALLLSVVEGSIRYATQSRAVDAERGSMHLLSTNDPVRFSVAADSRFLLVLVPGDLLQAPLRAATATTVGPVATSGLTAGLAALTEAVLDPGTGGAGCPAARAVRSLAIAALEDAVPEPGDQDLRTRILDHIDRHLSDVDLGPQSIADTFGISLRWVHHVFNVDDVSVARHIRARRLDVVAAQLRSDHRFPRIGALAARSGFGSRDQLTRAFRGRFGMTLSEYAAQAAGAEETTSA